MSEAIFEPSGNDAFVATEAAVGPWTDDALHGGPPTMLLARAIERFASPGEMLVTRLTVELLRPVGRTPLTVSCREVRPGRKVQLIEATLLQEGREVARGTALRIRRADVEVPERTEPPPLELGDTGDGWDPPYGRGPAYHMLGVEIRTPSETRGDGAPGRAWIRLRVPLLSGEQPSPLVRACAAADFPNGISYMVDPRTTAYINPDLTLYLHRAPAGEWILLDARTWLGRHGVGMAEGALYDQEGRIGRSNQALVVEPRAPR